MVLNVISWNCAGGLKGKIDMVRKIAYDTLADFLFVSEAEFKGNNIEYLQIDGFHLDVANSLLTGKARLVCYVANNIKHQFPRLTALEGNELNLISYGNKNLRIAGVYRGFTSQKSTSDELTELFSSINNIGRHDGRTIIQGDFNIDPVRDANTKQGRMLGDCCTENGFVHLMKKVTRKRVVNRVRGVRFEESCIDLALSNDINADCVNFDSSVSDHDFIWTKIPFQKEIHTTKKVMMRDYTKLTAVSISRHISNDINSPSELELEQKAILEKLAPLRVIRTRLPTHVENPRVEKLKKRRDRLYKKYKKTGDNKYLIKANDCSKHLKKLIKHELRESFQRKAQSPNVKCFWSTVNQLQGKKSKPKLALKLNGVNTMDEKLLSEHVAEFFDTKIRKLTSTMSPISFPGIENLQYMEDFTDEEVLLALKNVKAKMSAGQDEIPLKLAKLYGVSSPNTYVKVFNSVIRNGFPQQWKCARVVPIPKKGDLSDVSNYRPVSNLCSVSKIFERCLLARLESLPDFGRWIGSHQHGFRKNHSTTSCLMELKDYAASCMDKNRHCIVYSLDLSAAFDMLRPDTFYEIYKGQIPDGILRLLLDFLHKREFFVSVGDAMSNMRLVERGCPQGSVLGPVLFSLYVGKIMESLTCDFFVSYADDSYVGNSGTDLPQVIDAVKLNIKAHAEALRKIGMVVNEKKTEVIAFQRKNTPNRIIIELSPDESLTCAESIQALGVTIDNKLSWMQHLQKTRNKIMKLISGMKIIRKKMSFQQSLSVKTTQVFSILYYASPVWLTPSTESRVLKEVEKIHFKALRVVTRDYKQRISKDHISKVTQRLPPKLWLRFAAASTVMKMWFNGTPVRLRSEAFCNTFTKRRMEGLLFGYDDSTYKVGKQITRNWCGSVVAEVKTPWTNMVFSKDRLRTILKSTFYPIDFYVFNH